MSFFPVGAGSGGGSRNSASLGAPSPLPSPASPTHRPAQPEAPSASTTAAGHPAPPPAAMDGHTGPPTDGLATNAVVESAGGLPPTPTGDVTANGVLAAADATNDGADDTVR